MGRLAHPLSFLVIEPNLRQSNGNNLHEPLDSRVLSGFAVFCFDCGGGGRVSLGSRGFCAGGGFAGLAGRASRRLRVARGPRAGGTRLVS